MNEEDKMFLEIMNMPDTTANEHIDKLIRMFEYCNKECDGAGYMVEDVSEANPFSMTELQSIAKSKGYVYCSGKDIKPRKLRDKTSNILYKIQD